MFYVIAYRDEIFWFFQGAFNKKLFSRDRSKLSSFEAHTESDN